MLWLLFRASLLSAGLVVAGLVAAGSNARDLYQLIDQRLSMMRDVAAYKWVRELPIEDLQREQTVVQAAVAHGLTRGLTPESSSNFIQVQIDAAKDIQRYWFARWRDVGPPDAPQKAPDLNAEIRPQLLALGNSIVEAAGIAGLINDRAEFSASVAVEGLDQGRTDELFDSLSEVRRFSSRLSQIMATGTLRVGTTGDYPPFSFSEDAVSYQGVDIDLARDLAEALGVDVVFVATSWPTLLKDLESGAYDIAMSGVSRTTTRQRVGFLSEPYFVGGKTPIARCQEVERFDTLAEIDRPGVRVIVNPGGTNEAFARGSLSSARLLMHPDNRTIFDALEQGDADVMITDSIEVELQTRRRPALCRTMSDTLTYQEKGYLMPRDPELKAFVDTWLSLRIGDGTVDRLIDEHLLR